jgi:hypothetical protein
MGHVMNLKRKSFKERKREGGREGRRERDKHQAHT